MTLFRPRQLSAVLSLVLPLAAGSCTGHVFEGHGGVVDVPFTPPAPGELLFEVEAVNFAWGKHWSGFVVDADGKVYAYDLSKTNLTPPQGDEFTSAELEVKYSHERRLVTTLSASEVQARYAAVAAALAGRLSARRRVCADAGIIRFTALLYDETTGRYRRFLLHQRGDEAQTNNAPAARELYHWLAGVTGMEPRTTVCDPFRD